MERIQKVTPCLWFDDRAEEAAAFYIAIFEDSRVVHVSRYPEAGKEVHGRPPESVLVVEFELAGQRFTALNGGPRFRFTEAISLQVNCATQQEIDHYWSRLSEGGPPDAQMCGWLKDRYGLSWQVVPAQLGAMMSDPDAAKSERVMAALLTMKKLELPMLERAFAG